MTKSEICTWLTPGLTPMRLVFISYGGSAHGDLHIEAQDTDSGEWEKVKEVGSANGHPKDGDGKITDKIHINQFTGKVQDERL